MYMSDFDLSHLKSAREQAGLSQKDVEGLLGMRRLTMRDYEVGRLKLPVMVAMDLAKLYQVSLEELVGLAKDKNKNEDKTIELFKSLFNGKNFSAIMFDPILSAYLEEHQDLIFKKSLFELVTIKLSQTKRKKLITTISRFLFSLASSDGKVTAEEIACIRFLLESFGIANKYKEISVKITEPFLPQEFESHFDSIEVRHFIIWLLFLFSHADGSLNYEELNYIEKCAEVLKVTRNNFIFIKRKFIEENE